MRTTEREPYHLVSCKHTTWGLVGPRVTGEGCHVQAEAPACGRLGLLLPGAFDVAAATCVRARLLFALLLAFPDFRRQALALWVFD